MSLLATSRDRLSIPLHWIGSLSGRVSGIDTKAHFGGLSRSSKPEAIHRGRRCGRERGPKLQAPSVWFRFSWVCDADGRALGTGKPFAKNFRETIGRLFRRLFRVYAHLYSNHFDHICALGIEGEYQ